MNYGNIKKRDIANGIGVRTTLFVSGCTHHCAHCFQPETWAFDYGQPFTQDTQAQLLDSLAQPFIHGLTLLGGEPMEPDNQRALLPFVRRVRAELPQKTIWCYTGYLWEELTGARPGRCRCEVTDQLLELLDVLVDGPFIEAQKDITLLFRGSANQRLIHVPETLRTGAVTLWRAP